jgi:hypothetical protein
VTQAFDAVASAELPQAFALVFDEVCAQTSHMR